MFNLMGESDGTDDVVTSSPPRGVSLSPDSHRRMSEDGEGTNSACSCLDIGAMDPVVESMALDLTDNPPVQGEVRYLPPSTTTNGPS